MRHPASPLVLLAAAALSPAACSLAVSSELDSKPTQSDINADGGMVDAPSDGLDEQADQQSPDAPDVDVDVEGGDAEPACLACPESCCDDVCVDLKNDPLNCGECGHSCMANRDCSHSKCKSGFVVMSPVGAPQSRLRACAVWTGSEMFVWGGMTPDDILLDSGGTYDPTTDMWRDVSVNGAPAPREEPTCVAMDGKVFVWGGVDRNQGLIFSDGAVWDPSVDSWTPIGDEGGPAPRIRATAFWTGSEVLIWGGEKTDAHQEKSGALYDPIDKTWKPISEADAPPHAKRQAWAWTGSLLYVFGGRDDGGGNVYNDMHSYTPALDAWAPIAGVTPPGARSDAFAAWTGKRFVVWGGLDPSFAGMNDGAIFDPMSMAWTPLSSATPPSARGREPFRSGWSRWLEDRWLIVGGSEVNGVHPDIALYDPTGEPNDAWSEPLPWVPNSAHEWGVGVWTGAEFIVWGGSDGSDPAVGGSRWMP